LTQAPYPLYPASASGARQFNLNNDGDALRIAGTVSKTPGHRRLLLCSEKLLSFGRIFTAKSNKAKKFLRSSPFSLFLLRLFRLCGEFFSSKYADLKEF
jgi:hypothetical protein